MDSSTAPTFSLAALRSGDRAEFARLMETYSGRIYRLGLKLLGNAQDAEDILQETFLKAFRHLNGFDGRSSLVTWLYRIASNEALMVLRRKQPQFVSIEQPQPDASEEQTPLEIVDWRQVPDERLLSGEGRVYLNRAIAALPDTLRVVFLLRDIEELSTLETAEALGLSETAVKTRLSRARMKLRAELSEYFSEWLNPASNPEPSV